MDVDASPALPEPAAQPSRWTRWGRVLREWTETLLFAAVLFLAIRFALPNFRIEGASMEPNFHDGQHIFANHIEYFFRPLERGDVIVFEPPSAASRDFIKRVIGLPGERVEVINGAVHINGEPLAEPYPQSPATYSYGPVTVGPNEYFVLGDNRSNSNDSHSWGMLPADKVIGRVWLIYFPLDQIGFVPTYSDPSEK
jgi:signal peptidase I